MTKSSFSVPRYNVSVWCASNQLLARINPVHCKQWLRLLVAALRNELRTLKQKVLAWLHKVPWVEELAVGVVGKQSGLVSRVVGKRLGEPLVVFVILKVLCVHLGLLYLV